MQLLKNVFRGLFIALLSVLAMNNSAYAQICDINTQKSLEQTHVAYYTEVTQGGDAIFTIRYPLVGTTYTFSDNLGTTYSITYTSGTEEFIYINAGAVNTERRFSLKAQNGACTYQSGFDYKVTPITTLKLATSVEHEWCGNGGAIRFTLIGPGANNNNYNFYYKKSNVPTYNTTTSLSLTGVTSLAAGKYDLLARPKSGTGDIEVKNIEIKKDLKDIDYTLSKIPATCASAGIGIKVDIKVDQWGNHSANYPVYYTLQDATGNNIPGKIRQTSNIFTGLTPGTYRVKVENFCGTSPTPKSITIASSNLTFTNLWGYPRPKEFNCDYVEFDSVLLYATSLREAYTSDTFPYPLTVKYILTAPSGAVYTPTYTINNKSDFYLYLPIGTRNDLGVENGFREHRIPKEYGVWKIAAEVEMCGTTTAIPAVTATLYNPIENALVEQWNDGDSPTACHKIRLRLRHKYIRDNSPILNTYLVLEQAPANFNYAAAGFYQVPATHPNPLLRGKFVKKIQYNPSNFQTVVAPDFIAAGDTFQFRLVDDECDTNRSNLMNPITITLSTAPQPTDISVRNIASCKDATATSAPYASMRIGKGTGSTIDKIEIIEYNGNTTGALPSTSISLPYTLTADNRLNDVTWYVRDLPVGNYKVKATNICGGVKVVPVVLSGQTYSFTFAPGCEPIVQGRIDLAPTDDWRYTESHFLIQQLNEATQVWATMPHTGLSLNQNINRKITDDGFPRKGKFRVVRQVFNSDNLYECVQVLAEKEFGGDLEEPDVIGVGCAGNKFHVMVIPKGGTGPFTYKLVHKIPAGSTTPDTSVAHTQVGDNFFLDLDGTNLNTAYKFTVTDACPSTKDRELTLSNIRLPKIKAQKEYYCVGQSAVLKMDDLGPNITIEWYRSDNMAALVATGHTLTIPALTAADFTNQYKVVIKIAGKPAAATCITNAIAAYQFQQITTYPSYTAPTGVNTSKCIEGNLAVNFDLNTLFTGTTPITGGVTTTIEDASGVIPVPANGIINLNRSDLIGTHTFLYKILSPCGELITQASAKLTITRAFKPAVKTTVKVCNASVTLNEVKQLIDEGSPEVVAKQPTFHWYGSLSDAQAQTSEIPATTSINTPNGSSQDYYLRFTKNNYCTETIYKITIAGESSLAPKTLTNTGCDITTVASLKALVDPADTANVLIYKNGSTTPLGDDAVIEDNVGYTYAKNVYRCITSPVALNFNFTPRSVAKNEQISVCTFIGYYGGLHTKVKDIKDALQVLYPNATITVLGSSSGNWYVQTNPNSDVSITGYSGFKIQEAGKCESLPYVVRLAQNDITPVQAQSITTCEEIMAGELADQLQAAYGYTNVEIIAGRSTTPLARTALVDWNTALYFTAEATGKCRSPKVPLTLIKDTNVTTATAKTFEVCMTAGSTPRVSDLKDAIGGGIVKIFVRSGAQWVLQADNTQVNPSNAYFYTLQATGKCPSIKTPLIVSLHTKPANAPTVSPTVTLCPTAVSSVVSLDAYVTALPAHTLRWYATATATAYTSTTPTINTQVTTKTTLEAYVVQVNANGCEGPRAVVTITVDDTTTPTLTTPAPLVVDCRNAAANISAWLNSATATDSCGAVNLTNNYNAVKPADLCNNSGVVTVTFTATDLFGKTVTQTSTITLVHIEANTDTFTITNGANGGTTTLTIFDNDKVGTQTATPATVSMTVVTPATGGAGSGIPTLNSNGTITVPAGTASGTYTIVYKICTNVATLTICDTATTTIIISAPEIKANADTFTITNGANGGTTSSVLTNDSLNGQLNPSTTSVTLTWNTVPAGIQTNTDGTLTVPAGTASGTYTVTYTICEVLNPGNCSTATTIVVVSAPEIEANADTFTITNGANGGTTSSVLTNDSLNGQLNPSTTSVTLTWNTVPAGIQTNTDGTLTVPAGTASGTYTVTYTICEVLNPGNCSTATTTIVVHRTAVAVPVAVNDMDTTPVNTPIVIDVLRNDTPHGITPHVTTTPANGTAVVNLDNTVTYTPNTNFVGTDTFLYELCNIDGVCVTATVTIRVTSGLTIYNAVNINGNPQNDHFHIGGIENYPDNTVRIFNRWGVKVFDVEGYDNVRKVFKGFSNGRVTIEGSENLPQGTYYYVIEYIDENNQKQSKVGWLYLKK
nr:gliding motility-associated C-terminal domain-containing protein [uncultured Capnocytophaga sp.]